MKRTSSLVLPHSWGLFALTLLAPAAHAQNLNLHDGDNVTVSGTGTVGTIGSNAVSNTTTVYRSIGNANSDNPIQINGNAAFTFGAGASIIGGKNGNGLDVNGSGPVTISGGSIGNGLYAHGGGLIVITGGTLTAGEYGFGIFTNSSSPIVIMGGTISGGKKGESLSVNGRGLVTISGGTISGGLSAGGSGPITITGGSFNTGADGDGGLYLAGSGPVTITGGTIAGGENSGGLYASGSGPVTITGGSIGGGVVTRGGTVTIKGGSIGAGEGGYMLSASGSFKPGAGGGLNEIYSSVSTIDLYGKFPGLMLGQTKALPGGKGSFTGTLQNNTTPQTFVYFNKTTIRLHDVALSPPTPMAYP